MESGEASPMVILEKLDLGRFSFLIAIYILQIVFYGYYLVGYDGITYKFPLVFGHFSAKRTG
jgi:hypothetical protein